MWCQHAVWVHKDQISAVSIQTCAWNCAFCCSIAIIRWSSVASAFSDALRLSKPSIAMLNSYGRIRVAFTSCWKWAEVTFRLVSPQVAARETPLIYKPYELLYATQARASVIWKSAWLLWRKTPCLQRYFMMIELFQNEFKECLD